jgi:hypothetical protein
MLLFQDPEAIASLPKYACPDLAARDGFWARPVKEELAQDGTRYAGVSCHSIAML